MSTPDDEVDLALLTWAQAGGGADEVERRVAAVRKRLGVAPPSREKTAASPVPSPSTPAPAPRTPIMDLSRPSLTPPARTPWRDPEYEAEVQRLKQEMSETFKAARDPFASDPRAPVEVPRDGDLLARLGIRKRG